MRKITADLIFPISSEPIANGLITVDDDGTILEIGTNNNEATEHHSGIICPGFVNTHCHLELSHMRSAIPEKTGMSSFIKYIIGKRSSFSEGQIQTSIPEAEAEMIRNGIVAVGDISNTKDTFEQKAKGNLKYHTFVEVFTLDPAKANEAFENGEKLSKELDKFQLQNSIVPHAPYTMSIELLKLIDDHSAQQKSILSIHNQESEAESEFFISNSGSIYEAFKTMGIPEAFMRKTGLNSLQSTLPHLNKASKLLLVHNTFTKKEDLDRIKEILNPKSKTSNVFWCTCPNANLYIENKLPNYTIFIEANAKVTIGTDSLASNWSLSILDELKTITKHYPQIPLQLLLTWATKNGAEFLGFEQFGTIEKGKKPGLNLLKNVDGMRIGEKTEILKLI